MQTADLCTRVGFGDDRSDNATELSGVSWLSMRHQPSSIYEGFLVNKWSTFTGDVICDWVITIGFHDPPRLKRMNDGCGCWAVKRSLRKSTVYRHDDSDGRCDGHCNEQGIVLPVTGKPVESSVRRRLRMLTERLNLSRKSTPRMG